MDQRRSFSINPGILQPFFYLPRNFSFISDGAKYLLRCLHLFFPVSEFSFAVNYFLWNYYNRWKNIKELDRWMH